MTTGNVTAAENLRTPLYFLHREAGARMVPFGGWDMPVQYPSGIISEARAVRSAAGLFDVSHMGRVYVSGPQAAALLDWTLTGSASTLAVGRARYCLICNEKGGVIDDTIFYRLADDRFLVIPNAGNRAAVVAWLQRWNAERFGGEVALDDQTRDTALLACQGPIAMELAAGLSIGGLPGLRPFGWTETRLWTGGGASADGSADAASLNAPGMVEALVARTGYTGEDGVEILCAATDAPALWRALAGAGAAPCGLGARDVLRLEAGLPLHGHELDEATTPVEANLERFVDFGKEFVGRPALERQRQRGVRLTLVGLTQPGRSAPRAEYALSLRGREAGQVTSGCYSPTLDASVGMGYVFPEFAAPGTQLEMDKRGNIEPITVTALPHYRRARRPAAAQPANTPSP